MPLPACKLFAVSILLSIGGAFQFGYQLLITNPAQPAFEHFTNTSKDAGPLDKNTVKDYWGIVVALFFLGTAIGSLLIHFLSHKLGRHRAIQFSLILQAIGCILSIASYYISSLYVYAFGRTLLGFALSVTLGISSIPSHCRGIVSLSSGLLLQVGILFGSIVAMPQLLGTTTSWPHLYSIELVMCLFTMIALCFFADSPITLVSRGHRDKAIEAIQGYHGISKTEAEQVVGQLIRQHEASFSVQKVQPMKDPYNKKGAFLGIFVMFVMIMSGIAIINAYAFEIFIQTGMSPLTASYANMAVCAMSVIGILVSSLFIDRFGRRSLLLITFTLLAVINIAIYFTMYFFDKDRLLWVGICLIVSICAFNLVFAVGPGPISLFLTAELVGDNARGTASSYAYFVMGLVRTILLAAYPKWSSLVGSAAAYISLFLIPLVLGVIVLFFNLPETKGCSFEEVKKAYGKLPGKKSKAAEEELAELSAER
ncbi:hypothetical protein WR25_03016 [Diploscapter pachys]|uniref:Major facilitator superfamily (MFS) profile domain-containing protein n=1 Tax=Diploscapter pachys TaxID=2018661 RepID=A0A2A2LUE5_9BILA|nr:hypothetical protein WR25_03016 [Diploscapter pachys]